MSARAALQRCSPAPAARTKVPRPCTTRRWPSLHEPAARPGAACGGARRTAFGQHASRWAVALARLPSGPRRCRHASSAAMRAPARRGTVGIEPLAGAGRGRSVRHAWSRNCHGCCGYWPDILSRLDDTPHDPRLATPARQRPTRRLAARAGAGPRRPTSIEHAVPGAGRLPLRVAACARAGAGDGARAHRQHRRPLQPGRGDGDALRRAAPQRCRRPKRWSGVGHVLGARPANAPSGSPSSTRCCSSTRLQDLLVMRERGGAAGGARRDSQPPQDTSAPRPARAHFDTLQPESASSPKAPTATMTTLVRPSGAPSPTRCTASQQRVPHRARRDVAAGPGAGRCPPDALEAI